VLISLSPPQVIQLVYRAVSDRDQVLQELFGVCGIRFDSVEPRDDLALLVYPLLGQRQV
jgi:hypothetical protein